jgi:hypothetical protein
MSVLSSKTPEAVAGLWYDARSDPGRAWATVQLQTYRYNAVASTSYPT